MKTLKQITRYSLDGQEFTTLDKVKTHVEDRLGSLIDKLSQSLVEPLKTSQKLELFKAIVKDKALLVELLTVEYEKEVNWQHTETINILDF